MFGMSIASDYLQKMGANQVREVLGRLSNRPFLAILIGIVLTVLLQSSGAVTSMLVTLGSANVIELSRVMGIILGAAVGSTLTVQLISFNIVQYGIPIFFVSFMTFLLTRRRGLKNLCGTIMGFGLIFWGMEMIGYGTDDLKNSTLLMDVFTHMNEHPLLALTVTTVMSAAFQSSAVVIGLAMKLATSHVITVEDAMYWVYGANLGTTATALLTAASGNYIGRQIAWAHVMFKLGGVMLFYFITSQYVSLLGEISGNPARDIANGHTFLNIVTALLFLPFIGRASNWIQKMFPRGESDRPFGPEYLTESSYDDPLLAFERARRETLRLGDIVQSMVHDSIQLLQHEDQELEESLRERDTKVDLLHREIKMHLVRINPTDPRMAHRIFELISFVTDLESVGDVIDHSILVLARKKQNLKLDFSLEGWTDLSYFHGEVQNYMTLSLSCFHIQDVTMAHQVIVKKRALREVEDRLREQHLERLQRGASQTVNTSAIHIEVLSNFRRIVGLMSNHAYKVIQEHEAKSS